VKFAAKLGDALNELVTIVHHKTMRRWIREAGQAKKEKRAKKGRPKTEKQIRELILLLARENDWGYTRILGELKKLGIESVSRNTVKNNLKENGLDPGPKRGAGTWDEFLKTHAVASGGATSSHAGAGLEAPYSRRSCCRKSRISGGSGCCRRYSLGRAPCRGYRFTPN
jgi:transposase